MYNNVEFSNYNYICCQCNVHYVNVTIVSKAAIVSSFTLNFAFGMHIGIVGMHIVTFKFLSCTLF